MTERHVNDMAFRGRMRQVNGGSFRPAALPPRPHTSAPQPVRSTGAIDGFAPPSHAISQPIARPVVNEAPPVVPKPAFSPTLSTHRPDRGHHNPTHAHSVVAPRQHRSSVLQRHSVQKSADIIRKATRRRRLRPTFILVLSSFLFVLGIGAAGYAFWTVKHSDGKVAGAQTEKPESKKSPFEHPPTTEDYKNYNVQADLPRYVRIPGLRINARAKHVDFSQTSGLETPANIYDMGWYKQSGRPNDEAAMVFSVRTKGKTNDSSYVNLDKLKLGNFIEVEQGDGNKTFYKVATISPVEPGKFNLAFASLSVDSKKQGLNIISYSPTTPDSSSYEPTLIVYAVRM